MPAEPADSAGQPWAGRHFDANPFAGDDGEATPALAAALNGFRAGTAERDEVVAAFRQARLLIPLVARLAEEGRGEGGHVVDKKQELSIVTVEGPDGRSVLPVFSSVATMQAWSPSARPVPADGARVALAAAGEGTEVVVLDPTSPTEFAIRRPALWALAKGQPWRSPHSDPAVARAFAESIGTELSVLAVSLTDGDPDARLLGPEVLVRLELVQGLTQAELDAVLARLAQRWAGDDRIALAVDSLGVQLVASE